MSHSPRRIANELNAVAQPPDALVLGPDLPAGDAGIDSLANQSGLAGGGGCGPLGLCLDTVNSGDLKLDTDYVPDSNDLVDGPLMSVSPVITAVFIVFKSVTMASLASILGPVVSIYIIVSSHWKFLERVEMVRSRCVGAALC